jgi:hypothetical protein
MPLFRPSRRAVLGTAALSLVPAWLGLRLGRRFPAHLGLWPAFADSGSKRSLILIWMDGGMSHLDTFDGKPEAPADIRGDLESMESDLEGVFVSRRLPRLAKAMRRFTIVRSLTSGEGNHDRGSHYLLTGHRPSAVLVHPALGAVLSLEPGSGGPFPAYVAIPSAPPQGREGFLPLTCGPFEVEGDPSRGDFRVKDLAPRPGLERALELLDRADALDGRPRSAAEKARDELLAAARSLSLDPEAREVFELGREKPELRERYGRHLLGQSLLLARRLVESGARTVMVRYEGWDHHSAIRTGLTHGYPPKLDAVDQAVSELIEDLTRRGLSERVVVALASEFGRTPRLNPAAGRDHWPRAHSALLFGAGLREGCVIGKTDARGEEPVERPVSPADLHATLLTALGADLRLALETPDGRPVRLIEEGAEPIAEALG